MTVVHTGVADLGDYVRQGDIVVAAAGFANLVTRDMIKPGAAVVGVVYLEMASGSCPTSRSQRPRWRAG